MTRGRRRPGRAAAAWSLALAALLAGAGCGTGQAASPEQEVVVLAASSLTEALRELAERYEAEHPGTRVVLSTGASSALAQQVVAGAPADVLAAASPETMAVVTEAGQAVGAPVVVARNRLQIAVPKGNPGRVSALSDLARPELDVALCAAQVPCGAAGARAFAAAGLTPAPDTLEQDAKAVLAKVRLGEVEGVGIPEAAGAVNDYPVAVLRGGRNPSAAAGFVALLTSSDGREVLAAAGFAPPP